VGRFATHIGKHCTVCGAIENDTYFFCAICLNRFGIPVR
jgi:predicted nucleic acid-binding Zn ribbon protein